MTSSPRRSPGPQERQRDAERTRQALIEAGRAEFAAKGLAGARVSEIADRAGVNKQLISYYFGGKEGLYHAILDRWRTESEQLADPEISLAEMAFRYLEAAHSGPDMRIAIREKLAEDVRGIDFDPDAPELVHLRRRQADGEIDETLDPAFVLLLMQVVVAAGFVFPADVKRYMGLDPDSSEYLEHVGGQLQLLLARLAPPAQAPAT
ncbi:TetR/AcrR family transcriptional regulator [Jannaschia sp. R86511]|uniref:TetR/AcrR family transcriptional regulator n=1 Tax=Jannaschia sp. R86511 TaxID=3093853 RepID=UPI0036D28B17